jgi:hypothetical protein
MGSSVKTIVHAKLGGDFNDGQPPWIPGEPEIESLREELQEILGSDYLVIATHNFVEITFYDIPGDADASS